jgi:hypothetical protein
MWGRFVLMVSAVLLMAMVVLRAMVLRSRLSGGRATAPAAAGRS